jgi:hypothetical protein
MDSPAAPIPVPRQARLISRLREALRLRRYSLKTEKVYIHWVKRYLYFHGMRRPEQMGGREVSDFLSYLARDRRVAPVAVSTQPRPEAASRGRLKSPNSGRSKEKKWCRNLGLASRVFLDVRSIHASKMNSPTASERFHSRHCARP